MSYVQSHDRQLRPAALAMVALIHGALLTALVTAKPDLVREIFPDPIKTRNIPAPPPPVPPDPIDQVEPLQQTLVTAPIPQIDELPTKPILTTIDTIPFTIPTDLGGLTGNGQGQGTIEQPKSKPVMVEPKLDQRFADRFQPAYPPGKMRAEIEGLVTVRVLVGTDGRVRQVEQVSASDPQFWEATRRQALKSWRFIPARQDGVAIERWFELTVRFEIDD